MNVDIKNHNLDHTHTIGKKQSSRSNPRPVIVKFIRYKDRCKVFIIKKKLKSSGTSITESLLLFRMGLLTTVYEEFGFRNVWTLQGQTIYMDESLQKPKVYYD